MKIEFTAATRPRMSSGVSNCITVRRTTTLMLSAAPVTARAITDNQKLCDRPKATVARPNTPTAINNRRPTCRSSGQRVSANDMSKAPTAGAARSTPKPCGPTCKMSRA